MYSILMAGNEDTWAKPVGMEGRDDFPLSRYLEYTDPAIETQLKPVSAATLKSLDHTPALFMSELSGRPGRDGYVVMRLGRVWGLSVGRGRITYQFVIEHDFGPVPVTDRAAFEEALDLGRMELTRTHWSVKDGDLGKALAALGLQSSGIARAVAPFVAPEEMPDEAPVVDSVEKFLDIILHDGANAEREVFYRGHSSRKYRLEPSLFRKNAAGGYSYLRREATLAKELLTAHPAEFHDDRFMIDKLVRMQHYGLPTRLLDVTSNPLVALYFCCATIKRDANDEEVDGEVIVLTTPRDEIKFFTSDTVSCIANLAMLDDADKDDLVKSLDSNPPLDTDAFNVTREAQRLLHVIGEEKPYFKPEIIPTDLKRIVFVKGRITNSRISSQAGAFLLFGQDAILPETGHSTLDIRRITVRNKAGILDQLARLNIRSSTIYPGIDKTAAEIARQHEDRG